MRRSTEGCHIHWDCWVGHPPPSTAIPPSNQAVPCTLCLSPPSSSFPPSLSPTSSFSLQFFNPKFSQNLAFAVLWISSHISLSSSSYPVVIWFHLPPPSSTHLYSWCLFFIMYLQMWKWEGNKKEKGECVSELHSALDRWVNKPETSELGSGATLYPQWLPLRGKALRIHTRFWIMPSCAGEGCTTGRVQLPTLSLSSLIFLSTSLSPFPVRHSWSNHTEWTQSPHKLEGENLERVTEREMEITDCSKTPFFHNPLKRWAASPMNREQLIGIV